MKWEYKVEPIALDDEGDHLGAREATLNALGEDGWEAVGMWRSHDRIAENRAFDTWVLFKRPLSK